MCLMENELCVCDLSAITNMTKSAVSHQLNELKKANLVRCRKEGKHIIYSLKDICVKKLLNFAYRHQHHKEGVLLTDISIIKKEKEKIQMHKHSHDHKNTSSNIAVAFLLNFTFAIIELIGGIFINSVAILSDAAHDFGDSLTLGMSWIFEKKSKMKPNDRYTYGYKRLAIIGAIINIMILSVATGFVIYKAITNIISPHIVLSEGMFVLSIFGMLANGLAVLRMKGSKKLLDKTVMFHLLEDLLGWIAVFFVSIILYFTKFYILDSILSLMISAILIKIIIENIKESYCIIMQASPSNEYTKKIKEKLLAIDGVNEILALHIWTLDGDENVLTAKIVVEENKNPIIQIKELLDSEKIKENTIEIQKYILQQNL